MGIMLGRSYFDHVDQTELNGNERFLASWVAFPFLCGDSRPCSKLHLCVFFGAFEVIDAQADNSFSDLLGVRLFFQDLESIE